MQHVPWLAALALVLFVALANLVLRRGRGPNVRRVLRSQRTRVDQWYRRRGWPVPYDEHGNRT